MSIINRKQVMSMVGKNFSAANNKHLWNKVLSISMDKSGFHVLHVPLGDPRAAVQYTSLREFIRLYPYSR